MTDQAQSQRTSINLVGIVKYLKKRTTQNDKTLVDVIISESYGEGDNREYVDYKLTAVGDAAATLVQALDSGMFDLNDKGAVNRNSNVFTLLSTENVRPQAQDVKAFNRKFENGQEHVEERGFNASILSFTAFNATLDQRQKGQGQSAQAPQQPAAAPQQAPAQAPQQAAPAQDDFDDDIPF